VAGSRVNRPKPFRHEPSTASMPGRAAMRLSRFDVKISVARFTADAELQDV
jgi:hypothetical protein